MLKKYFRYLQQKKILSMFYLDFKLILKIRKPKLLFRILHNYLILILLKKRRLRSVDFAPTYVCNMNCEHCFALPMLDNKKETMTLEDFKIVSSQAKRMGAIHFALQGGEPLLLVDLEKIIAQIGPSDAFISITTNGALMTKELFLRLKKLGLDMLTVSIDSGIPQEHDKFRGVNGSFRKAVNAINIAREYNVSVTVNTTITHENISSGGFEEIVKLCDKLKVKLNILFPAICGRYAGRPDMMLSQDEKDKVQNIINKHVFVRRDLDANYLTYGCGAVKEMIYISAYGDVMPCSFIHASLGNIKTDLLSSCVEKGLQFSYFSGYCPVCPPMEDADFINKYMRRISGSKTLPAAFEEIFY